MKLKLALFVYLLIIFSCNTPLPPITIPPISNDAEVKSVEIFQPLVDYDAARNNAKEKNKPLLLFFAGYACVNARKMEEYVLMDTTIVAKISDNFMAYIVYVDDKTELATENQYISKRTGKKITTVGGVFMELETEVFKNNTQPFFAIVDTAGVSVATSMYTQNREEFVEFLKKGLP